MGWVGGANAKGALTQSWLTAGSLGRLGISPSELRASRSSWDQNPTKDVTMGDNTVSRVYCNAIRIGGQKIEGKEVREFKD
jgi:hypothetical protein